VPKSPLNNDATNAHVLVELLLLWSEVPAIRTEEPICHEVPRISVEVVIVESWLGLNGFLETTSRQHSTIMANTLKSFGHMRHHTIGRHNRLVLEAVVPVLSVVEETLVLIGPACFAECAVNETPAFCQRSPLILNGFTVRLQAGLQPVLSQENSGLVPRKDDPLHCGVGRRE